MNDKLKLPLTAVFSFLLGSVIFFPWGDNAHVATSQLNTNFIFDKIDASKTEGKAIVGDTQVEPRVTENIIVEYRFSEDELQASNLTIKNQLKGHEVVSAEMRHSNNKKEVQNFDNENEALALRHNNAAVQTIVVEYRFSKEELHISNLAIHSQLKRFNVTDSNNSNEQVALLSENFKTVENIKPRSKVKAVDYNFSAEAIDISNIAIAKQLARDLIENEEPEIKNETHLNISDIEVAEKSETDHFVDDVAEYANDGDNAAELEKVESGKIETYANSIFSTSEKEASNNAISAQLRQYKEVEIAERPEINPDVKNDSKTLVVIEKLEIKKYTTTNFSGNEFEISNLAISKQLRGYQRSVITTKDSSDSAASSDNNVVVEEISEPNKNLNTEVNVEIKREDESKLLLSNTEHEDDEEYSDIPVQYEFKPRPVINKATLINEDDFHDDGAVENEDDDDEDEYSSERVMFSVDPLYFIDSFVSDSIDNVDSNLDIPAVENINKNSKLELDNAEIEEIEINDDGKVVTSTF